MSASGAAPGHGTSAVWAAVLQDTVRGPEIDAVQFMGPVSLDRELFIEAIASKPSRCRTPLVFFFCLVGDFDFAEIKQFLPDTAQVGADAERLETLYEIWGYPDALVSGRVEPQDDGDVIVVFDVDEGAPILIRSMDLRGLDAVLPPIPAPRPLPLSPGEPYALPRLESLIELLQAEAAARGHRHAQVEVSGAVDEPARAADLVIELQPGPLAVFGETSIDVEPPITERAVRERLAYRPGDRFAPERLELTVRRLYGLPVVERAVVRPIAASAGDTVVRAEVLVEARRVQGFEGEGTLSSTDCFGLTGLWRHRYFLGAPRVFALGASVSNLFAAQTDGGFPCGSTGSGAFGELNHEVQAELWQPSLFGDSRYALRIGGHVRRQSSPNAWIERGWGGRLGVSRELGRGFTALLDYRFERNELEASGIYFCGNYGVCSEPGIRALAEPARLAPLEAAVLWTSSPLPRDVRRADRDPGTPWDPTRLPDWRFTTRIAVEGAGAATGSEYAFGRSIVEATGTGILGRAGEIAARVRVGGITGDDVLPPQIRLFSGGVNTVRGAEQNLLGPKVLLATAALPNGTCADPAACDDAPVDPALVSVRPIGGDRLFEANVEARYWMGSSLQLAAFLDYGRLTSRSGAGVEADVPAALRQSLLTPGIGFRVITDLGPIRVDLGYDPSSARTVPLFAESDDGGIRQAGYVRFDPFAWDDPGFFRELSRRLQFHFAIGQAF